MRTNAQPPTSRPLIFNAKLRHKTERAINRLIDLLDALGPDADLEPDDEPEDDDPGGSDVLDACEPALGAPENHHDQRHWATGGSLDFYADDREADSAAFLMDQACASPANTYGAGE